MAAASTVSFTIGGTTATVNGPKGDTDVSLLPQTVTDLAADYTRYSYRYTSTNKWLWSVRLSDLTAAQKLAFEDFFRNTAIGPSNAFTYVHTDGASYANCRFVNTELRWMRENEKLWGVQVQIEVPSQVA